LKSGIISCGIYLPRLRIKREEYQGVWGQYSPRWIEEKTLADFDEDPITMGVEAAANALRGTSLDPSEVDALYFASTSAPYAEKENATTIAAALDLRKDLTTLDITSSISSGTSALLACVDFVASERGRIGLAVAADSPHGDPTASFEHQLGAAAAGVVVGRERVCASVERSNSITSESLGERFRRRHEAYTKTLDIGPHYEAMRGQIVTSCIKNLMDKIGRTPKDYDWLVLQGVDDSRTLELAKRLGFEERKASQSMISSRVGDVGSASSLLALCKVLESAIQGQHVMLCSYAPGAGADAISLAVEEKMRYAPGAGYEQYLGRKKYVNYATYLKLRRLIGGN
jgi:hydroxymethylglutaryl-CoA synthase